MYDIKQSKQFKKDYKLVKKQKFDEVAFKTVLELLVDGKPLPEKYQDHPLYSTKNFKNCRELHIFPDFYLCINIIKIN